MKATRMIAPSLIVGVAISTAITMAITWNLWRPQYSFTLSGEQVMSEQHIASHYPWFVILAIVATGLFVAVFDYFYRRWPLRWPTLGTSLFACISSLLSLVFIVEYSGKLLPSNRTEPDIPAIQEHLFGEHGTFLKDADKVVLYSTHIDPYQAKEGSPSPELFHGHEVYGSTIIDDPETIQAIQQGLQNRIHWQSDVSIITYCWWPRHGLRVHRGDEIRDYHICFQCNGIAIHLDQQSNESTGMTLISEHKVDDPTPDLLNGILDKAGIERDRSNCK